MPVRVTFDDLRYTEITDSSAATIRLNVDGEPVVLQLYRALDLHKAQISDLLRVIAYAEKKAGAERENRTL